MQSPLPQEKPWEVEPMIDLAEELKSGSYHGELITTAIINIAPQHDLVVLSLARQASQLRDFAVARVIATDADLTPATDDLSIIAKVKKALTEKKADYLKPIKVHVDAVNAAFATIMQPIEEADKITRLKVMAYRAEQESKARQAEDINRLRMEAAEKEMKLKGELTESVNLVEVPIPVHRVSTDLGSASTMKVYRWELTDLSQVPPEYKKLDEAKITAVVKASKGSIIIPGIRVYEDSTIRVTTR